MTPRATRSCQECGQGLSEHDVSCPSCAGPERVGCTPRLVLGIGILAIGVLLALESFGVVDAGAYLRFWPLLLVALGVAKLSRATDTGSWFGAFFLIGLGGGLLLDQLDYVPFRRFWPFLVILAGLALIQRALPGGRRPRRSRTSGNTVSGFAFMSGVERGSGSQDFRGGELTAVMGGCEVDLSQASISGGEAVIDTFAFWGGVEIRVPTDWDVTSDGFALMGAFEDSTRHPEGSSKKLLVKGLAIMGGVEIKN